MTTGKGKKEGKVFTILKKINHNLNSKTKIIKSN